MDGRCNTRALFDSPLFVVAGLLSAPFSLFWINMHTFIRAYVHTIMGRSLVVCAFSSSCLTPGGKDGEDVGSSWLWFRRRSDILPCTSLSVCRSCCFRHR